MQRHRRAGRVGCKIKFQIDQSTRVQNTLASLLPFPKLRTYTKYCPAGESSWGCWLESEMRSGHKQRVIRDGLSTHHPQEGDRF
jgi:hypothetical protein